MAGKFHRGYAEYIAGTSNASAPQRRHVKAYAEGYNARRNGGLENSNPHPIPTPADINGDFWTWDKGWLDANLHLDPSHVGGPASFA
jgi:hypothetical protein